MKKTVLFDLDGTLLPMDLQVFINSYILAIGKKFSKTKFDPSLVGKSLWAGIKTMFNNDGSTTNENNFWNTFYAVSNIKKEDVINVFDDFYNNEFNELKSCCGYNGNAVKVVETLKENGYNLILATNPAFPPIATKTRLKWAGINPDYFDYITTYDNSSFCKPNLNYYKEILSKNNLLAQDCIMVGNDVDEDMVASKLNMEVFLLTECLINKNNEDISKYNNGNFSDLLKFFKL